MDTLKDLPPAVGKRKSVRNGKGKIKMRFILVTCTLTFKAIQDQAWI